MPRSVLPKIFFAAALTALTVQPAVKAQSGSPSLVLYSDTGLRGQAVEIFGDEVNLQTLRFNDQARSVELRGSGVWLLCSDAYFRGRCEYIDGTVRNLGEIGLSGSVSSAKYTEYSQGPRSFEITFFADSNFRGPFIGFNEGEASFGKFRFNDTASSVLINRGTWLVCEDADYRGHCEVLDASASDLTWLGLNDRITSFRRYDLRREGPWRPPGRPVDGPHPPGGGPIYGDEGYEGENTVFFPTPMERGRRIPNTDGAATRFCQDRGFYEAVYKGRGRVLSDVLCR